jgi:hypothetical protein
LLRAIVRYLSRHHVALLALFLALGGTSVAAANYVNGKRIKPGSIPENRLAAPARASFTAADLVAYCRTARSHPRTYAGAPCKSRSEVVAGGVLNAIAIGTDGNPNLTFGGHPARLLRCNDPACAGNDESTQDINGTFCGAGRSDLAITLDGYPIVSQPHGGCVEPGHLNVADCSDPGCVAAASSVIFDVQNTGQFSSVAIGSDGNPVVSYYDGANGDLKVLHCNDRSCDGTDDTSNVVDGTGDVGQYTSLAIGKNGFPVIAYYDVTNHDLKVARCNDLACAGGNETISRVESTGDVGEFASLAIGLDGNPVIAYYKRSSGDLKVARCNDPACAGGNETRSTVSSAGDVGQHASLGIGLDGLPAVAFYDATPTALDLRIARCNDRACAGGNEKISTLDSTGDVGQNASLAIGLDGVPIVAYMDVTAGTIRVARASVLP